MHVGQVVLTRQRLGMLAGHIEDVSVQHHLTAVGAYRVDLDARGGAGHDDDRTQPHTGCGQCQTLGVIAGRSGDHTALAFLFAEAAQFVVGATQLEREYRLQILTLEPHTVAESLAQFSGKLQRGLNRNLIDVGTGKT